MNCPVDIAQPIVGHSPHDPVMVEFDDSLWLRNSTEEFLCSVRPRLLAAAVLQLLAVVRPWRIARNEAGARDWVRVMAIVILAPWSIWRWRRIAAELGPRLLNRPMLDAARAGGKGDVAVTTTGFREIVEPLLASIDPKLMLVEGRSLTGSSEQRASGTGAPSRPVAFHLRAGLKPLMPFAYLQRVKRPDENYLRNAVLGHDFPVLVLAYAMLSPWPWIASAVILLYLIAFFTAYEVGYYENDRLGLKLDSKTRVSPYFRTLGQNFSPLLAWCIAILLAGVASFLAFETMSWIPDRIEAQRVGGFFAVWGAFVGFLLIMRLLFRWQNVIGPQGRIVPMLFLQVGRLLGYAVILPTTIIGGMFCVAHGISRWIPYVIYRFGGSREEAPNHLICFLLLTMFALAVVIGGGLNELLNWQAALIFGYAALRAAKNLVSFRAKLAPLPGIDLQSSR